MAWPRLTERIVAAFAVTVATEMAIRGTAVFHGGRISELIDGRIGPLVLLERTSIEVFANRAKIARPFCFLPNPGDRRFGSAAEGHPADIVSLAFRGLRSAWPK